MAVRGDADLGEFRLERISQLARMRPVSCARSLMFRLERISQLARILLIDHELVD